MLGIGRFVRDRRGTYAITSAVLSVPLFAAIGLGIDYARLSTDHSNLQSAADSAALAAIAPYGISASEREKIAKRYLSENFHGSFRDTVVNVTTFTASRKVTVTADAYVTTSLMNLVGINEVQHKVTAVAATRSANDVCLLSLNTSAQATIMVSGSGAQINTNCMVQANSKHSGALEVKSNTTSVAARWCSVGGYTGNDFTPTPKTGCDPIEDPYADLPVPYTTGCKDTNFKMNGGKQTLSPGIYCGGMSINGGDVTFQPGLYVIKDGQFKVGSANLVGSGVTFYLFGNNATVDLSGNAELDLSAPKTGPYAGMVFIQHPNAAVGAVSKINGTPSAKLIGVSYFPTQNIVVGGGGAFGSASPFMSLVANTVSMNGNGTVHFKNDPAGAGYTNLTLPGTPVPYLIQ